jgi:hypothetical protein
MSKNLDQSKRTVSVKFTTDRNGKRRAYRWSWTAARWFPMGINEAEILVATGAAAVSRAA